MVRDFTVSGVTVFPSAVSAVPGASQQFSATVTIDAGLPQDVTWTVSGGNGSSVIDSDGLLYVDSGETPGAILTVEAVSTMDSTQYGTAALTAASVVTPLSGSVSIGPSGANAGGIAGENTSVIQYCWFEGNIETFGTDSPKTQQLAGGIAGDNPSATITNSVALNNNVKMNGAGNVGRVYGYTSGGLHDNKNGADVDLATEANSAAWWQGTPPSGPGWAINAAGTGNEASPWEWGTNRPKLWFE